MREERLIFFSLQESLRKQGLKRYVVLAPTVTNPLVAGESRKIRIETSNLLEKGLIQKQVRVSDTFPA